MCLMSAPRATKRAPSAFIARKRFSPCSSIETTSVKSTTYILFDSPRTRSHAERSSATHGPLKRPHKIHRCLLEASSWVILSILHNLAITRLHSHRRSVPVLDLIWKKEELKGGGSRLPKSEYRRYGRCRLIGTQMIGI
jgi:hypothetical protein